MKWIYSGALVAFKKALTKGKIQKTGQVTTNQNRNTNTVLDYTLIPADSRIPGQFEENQAIMMSW